MATLSSCLTLSCGERTDHDIYLLAQEKGKDLVVREGLGWFYLIQFKKNWRMVELNFDVRIVFETRSELMKMSLNLELCHLNTENHHQTIRHLTSKYELQCQEPVIWNKTCNHLQCIDWEFPKQLQAHWFPHQLRWSVIKPAWPFHWNHPKYCAIIQPRDIFITRFWVRIRSFNRKR